MTSKKTKTKTDIAEAKKAEKAGQTVDKTDTDELKTDELKKATGGSYRALAAGGDF